MLYLKNHSPPSGDRLTDLLPWALLVAPGVIEQKDGLFQKTISLRGPDLASSTRNGLIANIAQINNALRRFGAGWSFFFEAQRQFSMDYPHSNWGSKPETPEFLILANFGVRTL